MIPATLEDARHVPVRRRAAGVASAVLAGLALLGVLPGVALAHPLGNFTINHYAAIRVTPDQIRLDIVVDQAEIPTFQARLDLDTDGDGTTSPAEADAAREPRCRSLMADIELVVDDSRVTPTLVAAGLHFPPGAGGLSTMRLVCELSAPLEGGIGAGRDVVFADRSYPDRLGWREIVAEGDGVSVQADGTALPATASARLTEYPDGQLATPLAMAEGQLHVTPGGPALPVWRVPDATPLSGTPAPVMGVGGAAVPGGAGADLPAVFRSTDVSPPVLLLAVVTAVALGAGHALTPGHGKSLMAAYLVGTRGTAVHAVGLGLSVTVSHTVGILVLAALIVLAQGVLAPDVVVRCAPLLAAVAIVGIGGWMLATEIRRRGEGREHGHEHGQGAGAHTHETAPGTTVTWRSLFALGLAGGVIPSTSALLILLGTIAAGRPAFGVVLLVAFGLGMAFVLGGIGILLVKGRSLLSRLPARSPLRRAARWVPLAAAVVVMSVGIWLAGQALLGSEAL